MLNRLRTIVLALTVLGMSASATSIYLIGNSLTDGVNYDALEDLAVANGKTHEWGRHMIPGAPLEWIWDHPDGGFSENPYGHYPNALNNYSWDFVSLQPFDRRLDSDTEHATNFINLAKAQNSAVQICIYGRWPNAGSRGDFSTWFDKDYTDGWDGTNETRDYLETLVDALRAAHTDIPAVKLIPISEVMYLLDQRMKAGEIPGYSSVFEVYTDGWHMDNVGQYICGLTAYAIMYDEDPVGVTRAGYTLDATLAGHIEQAVHNVVTTYAHGSIAGVGVPRREAPRASVQGQQSAPLYDLRGRAVAPRGAVVRGTLPRGVYVKAGQQSALLVP